MGTMRRSRIRSRARSRSPTIRVRWNVSLHRTDLQAQGVARIDTATLLDDVIAAEPGPRLRAAEVARDEIWTYECVPGRRLDFPYEHEGLTGSVQLDFVYNEKPVRRRAAGRASALTWDVDLRIFVDEFTPAVGCERFHGPGWSRWMPTVRCGARSRRIAG